MLALAAVREKKPGVARTQLTELVAEFPENQFFANELATLDVSSATVPRCFQVHDLTGTIRILAKSQR